MARYLTPATVGLLCLLEIYTDGAVSASSTIPILSFIASHLLPQGLPKAPGDHASGSEAHGSSLSHIVSIKDFERVLAGHPAVSDLPGRSLWDVFVKKLWCINSLDSLHVFFGNRSALLAKTREMEQLDAAMGNPPSEPHAIRFSRSSPFGVFVRRAQLEFARLKFQDAAALWKCFITYRQPTLSAWKKRNPSAGAWSFDAVMEEESEEWGPEVLQTFVNVAYDDAVNRDGHIGGLVSTNDVEKLLEFQIEQMQSKLVDLAS